MRTIIFAIALLVTAGCTPTIWSKPDGDNSKFEQDKAQCIYEVNLHGQDSDANPLAILQLLPECLRAKGYVQQ